MYSAVKNTLKGQLLTRMGGMRAHDVGSSVSLTERYHVAPALEMGTFPPMRLSNCTERESFFSPHSPEK
jgi:hypothetical protein